MNTTTLFPSTLIISRSTKICQDYINHTLELIGHQPSLNNPDLMVINEDTGWGIDIIRKIKIFLSRRPFSHSTKLVIIFQTENLNTESQNALLKSLEEPGLNNYLLLFTARPSSLISTIISRCQVIKTQKTKNQLPATGKIQIQSNIKTNLATTTNLNQGSLLPIDLLRQQLDFYQLQLVTSPNKSNCLIITKIIKAIQMIEANVDSQSALDFLFLS